MQFGALDLGGIETQDAREDEESESLKLLRRLIEAADRSVEPSKLEDVSGLSDDDFISRIAR